jgi:uncharacterized membrane protein YgaE (UPF0421/DUF939 family)
MIKLFRNIRQNLLAEGKTSKYIKYAIGEIILVVIGILIALSINNWNEKIKTQEKVDLFLTSLKSDLLNDLSTISDIIKIQEDRLKSLEESIAFGDNPQLKDILANNDTNQISVGRNWTFFPVAGAYKAAIGTGLIESLQNDNLKKDIINLYEYYYNRIHYNGQLSDDRNELFEWESRMYSVYSNKKLLYDEKGLFDKDFLKQLAYVSRYTSVYIILANDTKLAIENTIKSIQSFEQSL